MVNGERRDEDHGTCADATPNPVLLAWIFIVWSTGRDVMKITAPFVRKHACKVALNPLCRFNCLLAREQNLLCVTGTWVFFVLNSWHTCFVSHVHEVAVIFARCVQT